MHRWITLLAFFAGAFPVWAGNGPGVKVNPNEDQFQREAAKFRLNFVEAVPVKTAAEAENAENWVILRKRRGGDNVEVVALVVAHVKAKVKDDNAPLVPGAKKSDGFERDAEGNLLVVGLTVGFRRTEWSPESGYILAFRKSFAGTPFAEALKAKGGFEEGQRVLWTAETVAEPADPKTKKKEPKAIRLVDTKAFKFDIRSAEDAKDELALAIDFYLKLSKYVATNVGNKNSSLSISFTSQGSVVLSDDDDTGKANGQDSIFTELSLDFSTFVYPRLRGGRAAVSGGAPDLLRQKVEEPLQYVGFDRWAFDVRAIQIDLHVRHETDQEFDDYAIAIGFGLDVILPFRRTQGAGIPWILLPLAPFLLHDRGDLAAVQQPVFEFDLDYVVGAEHSKRIMTTSDSEYPRITMMVGWTSEVFRPNTWLYFRFVFYAELGANRAVKTADLDTADFFEVGLKIPIEKDPTKVSKWIVIKYVTGKLPPNFGSDSQVAAGISFDF